MSRRKRLTVACALLIGLNLCFIWGNSLLPAASSGALSTWLKGLLHSLFPNMGMAKPSTGDHLLRKCMHFTEFASLGFLLTCFFALRGKKRPYFFGLALGVCAAAIDECIQIFVPGRGPGVKDVCIDSAGVAAGIVLLSLLYALIHACKKK